MLVLLDQATQHKLIGKPDFKSYLRARQRWHFCEINVCLIIMRVSGDYANGWICHRLARLTRHSLPEAIMSEAPLPQALSTTQRFSARQRD